MSFFFECLKSFISVLESKIVTTRYLSIDTPGGMVEPEELGNFVKSLWLDGNSLAISSKIKDTVLIDQKFDYLYRAEKTVSLSQSLITDGKGDSWVYSQKATA